ncbi:MAG: polyphosphate polymerase domain-containing protein [Clostridia bacterium]|nr:polyphosphate polymerase domain-containing protein [Clostridia bacterium]
MKGVGAIRRTELKYLISLPSCEIVRSRLSAVLPSDPYASSDLSYRVYSLYFDDPLSTSYFEKEAGVRDRKKIRIRYYNGDPSFIRLEEKEKIGSVCEKHGVSVSRETAEDLALCRIGAGPYSDPLLEIAARMIRTKALSPRLFTVYRRTAFRHPAGDLRITLDREIEAARFRGCLFDPGPVVPILNETNAVLEIKYNGVLPAFVRAMLADVEKTPAAVSKYCAACEALF